MNDEGVTYTKEDLVELINVAGSTLILKRKKISIESEIQKTLTEIEYKKELVSRFEKKAEEIILNCKAALEKSEHSKKLLTSHINTRDDVRKELERMLEIEKKSALLGERDAEIVTLTDTVNKLESQLIELRAKHKERIAKKEQVEQEIEQSRHQLDLLKESVSVLSNKKEELSSLIPHYDGIDDLVIKQGEAERDTAELKNRINTIMSELRTIEIEFPSLKERAAMLKAEKETLGEKKAELEKSISAIGAIDDKEELASAVNELKKRMEAGKSEAAENLRMIDALKKEKAQTEASIVDEENFIKHFEEINTTLQIKKTELDEVTAVLAKVGVQKEANQSVLEMLQPITEYVKNINNTLYTVKKGYQESYRHIVNAVVTGAE
ncbi:MAG: hypothetical protein HQK94_09150 [Nitrospirae bacterium]|nr:hypothetical protein [Nitrospirota bacterium]